jgi:hypothetical protein
MTKDIKRIEIYYKGKNRFTLPVDCTLDGNIISFIPASPIDSEMANSIFRQIKCSLIFNLLLNDAPFELKFKEWIKIDKNGIERTIEFADGMFTVGTPYFASKPIQIGDIKFDFNEWINRPYDLIDKIDNWLDDCDLRYMIDSYNIGLLKREEELFYMYAIYECMKYKDNSLGEKFVTNVLGLKREDQRHIHDYCNKANIRNSRHAGRVAGKGDTLSVTNLQRVRSIIKELIIRYAFYISENH